MRANLSRAVQNTAYAALTVFLMSAGVASAAVTLTARPTTAALADGQSVPMWGLFCGSATAVAPNGAPCTTQGGAAQNGTTWQPPLITVPAGQSLDIVLVNNLPTPVPTSLVIVGQLGGGLGGSPTRTPSPTHAVQGTTWPGTPGTTNPGDPVFMPPAQKDRVQSFATEVAAGATSGTLSWTGLKPGTYLLESGTHPSIQGPMGLYGIVVVTDTSVTPNQAYPGVAYDKDVTVLLSEIDPVQNAEVAAVVANPGFSETRVWSGAIGACGDVTQPSTTHTCYPPAVNFSPRYYLVNGLAFDRGNPNTSALAVPGAATSGNVLLRFVNAGLRMHVPSVVGLDMKLIAEDGNVLPGIPKVQNSVFLAAGKTYDVMIQPKQTTAGTYDAATYAIFDRELSLSTNNQRDGGMQTQLQVNGGAAAVAPSAAAHDDNYFVVAGNTLTVSDPAKGLLANDVGVYGATVLAPPPAADGTLTLNPNGTFTFAPNAGITSSSFTYCANGTVTSSVCSSTLTATVHLNACTGACLGAAPAANADSYTSSVASRLQIAPPGVLTNDVDPSGLPLTAQLVGTATGGSVTLNPDGSFVVTPTTAPVGAATATVSFQYNAVNSQHTASTAPATATVTFKGGAGLVVSVKDAKTGAVITDDYRWIIEEDRTAYIDPTIESGGSTPVRNVAVNFHTSQMPVVAQGCVGPISCESGQTLLGVAAVCDVGNGSCRTDAAQKTPVDPGQVALDPTKRYYISILPGDAWITDTATNGHTMSGAPIAAGQTAVDVFLEQTPLEPAKISVFVFEDDFPLNGEHDAGGGVDILAPNEPGLGSFNIVLLDQAGNLGDSTGQITYDMFNMPISNALAGSIDPATGLDACPIAKNNDGLVGVVPTCPTYESDGVTLSPLAGHAVIDRLYAGLYEVMTSPAADRIARGEEWLQTNTLDGTKAIEAFIKPGEPAYFQEFGPGGYHVAVGFANPTLINARKTSVCAGQTCTATINGKVTGLRFSRTPDQRVYSSGSYDMYSFAQCYVSLGAPDSADFAFAKCNPDGTFTFTNVPRGNMKVTVFDQWNDLLVDGLSTPIKVDSDSIGTPSQPLEIPITQWRTNLYGRVFLDQNGDGVSQAEEPGLPLVPYNLRYRDGSYFGFNNTDMAGYAGFNEVFPLLNWLVVDIDSARYKLSGIHAVYDAGGPVDGTTGGGTSTIAAGLANTIESPTAHLPVDLRVPGARYCLDADCTGAGSFDPASGNPGSTGRVDPGWVTSEGWQGLLGNNGFLEFAMKPFVPGENGGIKGHVIYASTRPFDDPALLLQLSWEPGVPNVKVNLYQEGTGPDGTASLKLVDTTTTTSWDDWAQGFHVGADGTTQIPNMSCPGQETTSPFYYTLENSTQSLNPTTPLPYSSRFKCYDGWSMLTQIQPAPYDGMYRFPSTVGRNPTTGVPTGTGTAVNPAGGSVAGTNCTICVANPDDGTPMLPAGKYVVEVIVPPGYELVKEEDKNILMGDAYIAPVTQQFAGLGNIFIMPDQAAMNAFYNPYNSLDRTTNQGATPRSEGDTGSVERFWPCVGDKRIVPDLNSLFPGAGQAAPFAGATRPLCDRKEVTLEDQMAALVKFYVFSSMHVASHYTGTITNDFASEFDPFSPQFGEKFAVPNVPVGVRDFAGKEIARTYADQWGAFNGVNFSSWTVWPPNPTGYVPQMMIMCMNDPGPILDTRPGSPTLGQMITDPQYNPAYSNFCYEWPFMPGQTAYLDTPVLPTMAFADRYNLPDCEYPDTTPAIKSVIGNDATGAVTGSSGVGPWVSGSGAGHTLTITALGDKPVINNAYSGPRATTTPYSEKFVTRHYGFGGTAGTVTIGGITAPIVSWSDASIQVTVPTLSPVQSTCTITQRTSPQSIGNSARCGELVVTAANGKKSIDTVTVTIAGKPPVYVTPASPSSNLFGRIEPNPLQTAIDNAAPGDLILVGPGNYKEMLLMWKPLRLQGVGAESVTINADAHPAGKLEAWRKQAVCLFGLTANGRPASAEYDGCPLSMFAKVDRIPLEGILGWDTTTNGNLAEQLQEPTLMGAYEGAGVTVLGRGVRVPAGTTPDERFGVGTEGAFPAGYAYLTSSTADCTRPTNTTVLRAAGDYGTGNFLCNPSRVDGVSIINSSQGGGGMFLHGWNHSLEIANTRIHGNHGTFTGGITVGTPEFPDPFIVGGDTPIPFAFPANTPTGTELGYGLDRDVRTHHNAITANMSIGDALYSGTNSGGGGVSFCSGSDGYRFNDNWVCGNLSTGDGGGIVHSGFSNDGNISRNWVLFNQSANSTIPTNGGGIAVLGAGIDRILPNGLECGATADVDCPPGISEGTGRNLVIDANLILGNSAESGTGGGLRLQLVNGTDVGAFPNGPDPITSGPQAQRSPGWNSVTITNNIIANNVAGWDGGGVSLQDALKVRFINNTVISNDTTASAGVLFNTLGAPNAAVPPPGCDPVQDPSCALNPVTTSTNQASGLVTMLNTPNMDASLPATITCPTGYGYTGTQSGACRQVSLPLLLNNVFWENRAFHIEVGALGGGQQNEQAVVTLVPSLSQTSTGFCATTGTANGAPGSGGPVNYWDIGVRGDTGPTNHASTFRLSPSFSILTGGDYTGSSNLLGSDPTVVSQYCNGARMAPERCAGVTDPLEQLLCKGYNAPPGRSETTGFYPVFALLQLTPAATVDEGNNWINLGYGPLSLSNASSYTAPNTPLTDLGRYSIQAGSPAINAGADRTATNGVPTADICGHARPATDIDIGAYEVAASGGCTLVTP